MELAQNLCVLMALIVGGLVLGAIAIMIIVAIVDMVTNLLMEFIDLMGRKSHN